MQPHFVFFVFSLVLRVHASFLDDFRHAVRHVEHGFEKILSDVVTDMEDTIHCTVAAMEHILIMNGILDKLSDYNRKCPDDFAESNAREAQHDTRIESNDFHARDPNKKDIVTTQELRSTIQNVNRTLDDILSRRTKEDPTSNISHSLRNKTNRLKEVSAMLRGELEKIFGNVRDELDKIDFQQKTPESVVWDEIQLLQKVQKDSNTSEMDEIRHVVDDAINVLKSDKNTNLETRNNDEVDRIVKELENTEKESFQDYKTGKEREAEKLDQDYKSSIEENMFSMTEKKLNKNHEVKPSSYVSPLFSSLGKNNEKDTINEVMDMMKETQVVNLLFSNAQPGTDLFGNSQLFNF